MRAKGSSSKPDAPQGDSQALVSYALQSAVDQQTDVVLPNSPRLSPGRASAAGTHACVVRVGRGTVPQQSRHHHRPQCHCGDRQRHFVQPLDPSGSSSAEFKPSEGILTLFQKTTGRMPSRRMADGEHRASLEILGEVAPIQKAPARVRARGHVTLRFRTDRCAWKRRGRRQRPVSLRPCRSSCRP